MLGEIELEPWKCIAELVDNAIDGYENASPEWKKKYFEKMRIDIKLPSEEELDSGSGVIEVRDYGPGMNKERLTQTVRAGWSGNDGYERLGMFGMGFNIATANLGRKSRIYSAIETADRFNWIDVDPAAMLEHSRKNPDELFNAEDGESSKDNGRLVDQGTRVVISLLNTSKVRDLITAKATSANNIRRKMGRIYSPLMEERDIDIRIITSTSTEQGNPVIPWRHCVWDKKRATSFRDYEDNKLNKRVEMISAYTPVKIPLGSQEYCNQCWEWFDADAEIGTDECPICNSEGTIKSRKREINGWIGVQRFFSGTRTRPYSNHYGIDLVRNGRVIEELSKDFFTTEETDGTPRPDYPLEGYDLGRIVGSLDISFCRCDVKKDVFKRGTENWRLVMEKIQGNGLRPLVSQRDKGVFVSTPLNRMTRAWGSAKISIKDGILPGIKTLIPGDVEKKPDGTPKLNKEKQPQLKGEFSKHREYAKNFWKGDPDYASDEKWWAGVEFADDFDPVNWYEDWKKENKTSKGKKQKKCKHKKDPAKCKICKYELCDHGLEKKKCPQCKSIVPDDWIRDEELSNEYGIEGAKLRIVVDAYVDNGPNRMRHGSTPMKINRISKDNYHAIYSSNHPMFSSFKERPIDYLLIELADSFSKLTKTPISDCYMRLKEEYCEEEKLDLDSVRNYAIDFLEGLREHIVGWNLKGDEFSEKLRRTVEEVYVMKHQGLETAKVSLDDGTFVQSLPARMLYEEVLHQNIPRLLDGNYFTTSYKDVTSSSARMSVKADISGALRQVCSTESSSKYNFEDLQAIYLDIKRLEKWMA